MIHVWYVIWLISLSSRAGQLPPATLPAIEPSARAEVASLLAEARAAESSVQALMILRDAEEQIDAERSEINPIPLAYLEGDLARTRGNVAYQQSREGEGDVSLLEKAQAYFQEALNAFDRLSTLCSEEMEAIEEERGRRNITRHRGWNEAREYRLRGQFASAWVHYQLGLCTESDVDRKLHFGDGIEAFTDFVGGGYFRNPVVVESYLGTSLCLQELGRYDEVIELLEEASRPDTPPDLYPAIILARMKAWRALKDYVRINEAAEDLLGQKSLAGTLSPTEVQILILQAEALGQTMKATRDEKARERQHSRCIELTQALYERGDPIRSELLATLGRNDLDTPIGRLADANALYRSDQTPEAIDAAMRGLKLVEVVENPDRQRALHADFLHLLVALQWDMERWARVHELACAFIRQYADDLRAADVCLRGIHAGLVAMDADPPLAEETFFDCLTVARQKFPDMAEAQKGAWYRAIRLLGDERYQAVVDLLGETPPESPAWREAQYGLALASVHLAQQAQIATTQPAVEASRHLDRARSAVERYAEAAVKHPPPAGDELSERIVQVAVVLARQLLDQAPPATGTAIAVLDDLEDLPEMQDEALDARLALRIEALMAAGDTDAATRYVEETLRQLASGERMIRSLTAAASPLESQLERFAAGRDPQRARQVAGQLVRLYRLLLKEIDPGEANADERERILRHRLAHVLRQAGEDEEAVSHYEWLVERIEPSQAGNVYRGLALAYENLKSYEKAIPIWRRLTKGLPRDTEGWYEARYHLIRGYQAGGDREHARKLLDYYQLQSLEIRDAYWRDQFEKLDRQLR